MKNKYLTRSLCVTILSAMVLSSPMSVMASDNDIDTVSDFGDGNGEELSDGETDTPTPEPDPEPTTPAPEPTTPDTPTPEPTTPDTPTPEPTTPDTPTPEPSTPTPEPTTAPSTPTAAPTVTPTTAPTATPTSGTSTQAVQSLINKINNLAKETLTVNDASRVQALRTEYNSLSADEKKQVTNYSSLVKMENTITELQKKQDAQNNGSADISDGSATESIGATGTPVYYVSNLHAGKEFYLDSLKNNYQLSFSDDFASVMDEIESEYKTKNKLSDASDSRADGLTTSADSLLVRNWQDILSIYVYEQSKNGVTEFNMDASAKDELAKIFAEMNPVVRDKDNITHVSYGNYHINHYIKQNNISQSDRSVLKKYTETDCKLLCAVVTDAKGFVRQSVGDDVSEERVNVITAAYSLVGEVGYFWGGKSNQIGKNSNWGSAAKVTADGSASSGTVRAYGLDCSGFVTWSVINGYDSTDMQGSVGDGTSDQWEKANVVSEQDAQPGDLVFQNGPEAGSDNHVGIICGKTDAGDWIAVHCSSSKNGVTVGEAYGASFRYIRQPSFYPTQAEVAQMQNEGASASNAEAVTDTAVSSSVTSTVETTASISDGLTTADTVDTTDTVTDTFVAPDADAEIVFADVEGDDLSDGEIVTGSVEVTDTLQGILDQNISAPADSSAILPQRPDNSDIEVTFED